MLSFAADVPGAARTWQGRNFRNSHPGVNCRVMDKAHAARRIAELTAEIRRHDRLYYVEAAPEVSDQTYHRWRNQFARGEKRA